MRRVRSPLLIGLFATAAAGCHGRGGMLFLYPHADRPNLAQSSAKHYESVSRIADHDRRALGDDLDLFFMTDRPTRLTRWR